MARARTWEAELQDQGALIEPDGRALRRLLEDARDIARAKVRHRWDEAPAAGAGPNPSVEELEEIGHALEQAHDRYLLGLDPSAADLTPRAHFMVDEIASALEFLFVHQTGNLGNPQLVRLAEMHKADPDTPFALAVKLMDYVDLAAPNRAALEKLGGFDANVIDDAADLAIELRQCRPAAEPSAEIRAAFLARNQLATLLQGKVAAVRNAAALLFHNRPEVLREFSPPGR